MGQFGGTSKLEVFTAETQGDMNALYPKTCLLKVALALLQVSAENCQLQKLSFCIPDGWMASKLSLF